MTRCGDQCKARCRVLRRFLGDDHRGLVGLFVTLSDNPQRSSTQRDAVAFLPVRNRTRQRRRLSRLPVRRLESLNRNPAIRASYLPGGRTAKRALSQRSNRPKTGAEGLTPIQRLNPLNQPYSGAALFTPGRGETRMVATDRGRSSPLTTACGTALQAGGHRFDPGTLHKLPRRRFGAVARFTGGNRIRMSTVSRSRESARDRR